MVVEPGRESLRAGIFNPERPPKVSFCIPTLNNEDTIEACLRSISDQTYPEIEIIIVDGMSNDRTVQIASRYTNRIFIDDGPLGKARQIALEEASGDIVALFDSDIVIPHKKWLRDSIDYFNYDAQVSTVWPFLDSPPGASIVGHVYADHARVIEEDRIHSKRGLFGGGNALFRRECLEDIGGINTEIHWGEDFDWANRLRDKGLKVVIIRDALYHDTERSLKEFMTKQFNGARTFKATGFGLMGLTDFDIAYEYVWLGLATMLRRLFIDRDLKWLVFPILLISRMLAYSYVRGAQSGREGKK